MEKYNVISKFRDKKTNVVHSVGGEYETDDQQRVEFLQEHGYLEKSEKIEDNLEFPKHTGGGYYELSNGEKIKGKDEATAAEEELKKSGE